MEWKIPSCNEDNYEVFCIKCCKHLSIVWLKDVSLSLNTSDFKIESTWKIFYV